MIAYILPNRRKPFPVAHFGALAQLGARHIRIVEVVGSNPICSINVTVHTVAKNPYMEA